jgi:hypothetical protein
MKRSFLLGDCPLSGATGLEIGPRSSPLVLKAESHVLYVDYATTETIRATLPDPSINPEEVVDVDIVWGDRPLKECVEAPVQYIVASHVMEHVPDLIGWLNELHDALEVGGILGLIIPDRRFTFDCLRHESVLSELVEAHLLQYRRPSVRQVFEVASLAVKVDTQTAWRGEIPHEAASRQIRTQLPRALELAESLVANPRYIDAHCWVFTPASFLDLMESVALLGRFPFVVEAFRPTEVDTLEFFVRLRSVGMGRIERTCESITRARGGLAAAPSEIFYQTQSKGVTTAPGSASALNDLEATLSRRIAELQEQNTQLQLALRMIESSTSWRLTAPLRTIVSRFRGRRLRRSA